MFARFSKRVRCGSIYTGIIPIFAAVCDNRQYQFKSFWAMDFVATSDDMTSSIQKSLSDRLDFNYGDEQAEEGEYHNINGGYSAKSLNELWSKLEDKISNDEISSQINQQFGNIKQEWRKNLGEFVGVGGDNGIDYFFLFEQEYRNHGWGYMGKVMSYDECGGVYLCGLNLRNNKVYVLGPIEAYNHHKLL